MIIGTDYSKIPGFSRLFRDFIRDVPFFNDRFPENRKLFEKNNPDLLKKAEVFRERGEAIRSIMITMEDLYKSPAQIANLELLKEKNALTVITGQQVGFLCSPLYIMLKLYSCLQVSHKLNDLHTDVKFVPVFWIEDNDHDNLEASQAAIMTTDNSIERVSCCPDCTKTDRTSVSQRVFDVSTKDIVANIDSMLPSTPYKSEVADLLKRIYIPGKQWSTAFAELLTELAADTGILFVRSSILREQGLYAGLAERELEMLGGSNSAINNANKKIEENNYHIQAKTSDINLFMHLNGKRLKIIPAAGERFIVGEKEFYKKDLINMVLSEPSAFSPNVLLRPVFQDNIFANAAYIAGPSEIGYAVQLLDVYKHFGVQMPAFLPRHSATFLGRNISRFIEKNNLVPDFFLKKPVDIEPELRKRLIDDEVGKAIQNEKKAIESAFSRIREKATAIDANLAMSTDAALHKALNQLEILEKKIFSAQKKHHDHLYEKYHKAMNYLNPDASLQERIISPISIINESGRDRFREMMLEITEKKPDMHYFISV